MPHASTNDAPTTNANRVNGCDTLCGTTSVRAWLGSTSIGWDACARGTPCASGMPCPSRRASPKKSPPICAVTPDTSGGTTKPDDDDDKPSSIVLIGDKGAKAYTRYDVSTTTVATRPPDDDHSTVG